MEPKEALRTFVEQALTGLPEGEDRERTREELIADLTDCYEGALSESLAPEAAYDRAVESLGDLNELCDGPRHGPGEPPPPPPGPRHGPGEPPPPPPSPRHGLGEPPSARP